MGGEGGSERGGEGVRERGRRERGEREREGREGGRERGKWLKLSYAPYTYTVSKELFQITRGYS